jgi:lipopolysaccharide assembly outer membrane protein LptD (OstA)
MIWRWLIPLSLAAGAFAASVETNAPVKNFSLPTFTKDDHRAALLRGNEALFISAQQINVTGMQLTLFAGDITNRVETVIISPEARFYPERNVAEGEHSVRVLRDDMEMSGTKWTYEKDQKKVVIDGNVRVIFHAQLKDLLK